MNPIYKFHLNKEVNLLDPAAVTEGRVLDPGDGSLLPDAGYKTTVRIPVTPGVRYDFRDASNNAFSAPVVVFYDKDGAFSSGSTNVSTTGLIGDDEGYIQISFLTATELANVGIMPEGVSFQPYVSPRAFPIYNNELTKEFEQESGQQFFRQKLSGKLTFVGPDYDWIVASDFDFQFIVDLFISYDGGATWAKYWTGTFWKTDCEFNADDRNVSVTPTVQDEYGDILAGLDKEYDIIPLAPEIVPVKFDKRPMIQVYVPGQTVIGCFLSGMWWEQECEAVTSENDLRNKYFFAKNKTVRTIATSGNATPALPEIVLLDNPANDLYFDITSGEFRFHCYFDAKVVWGISQNGVTLWEYRGPAPGAKTYSVTLKPVTGSSATGNVTLNVSDVVVWARYVLDVLTLGNNPTHELPSNDMVPNNRNYTRAIGYGVSDIIFLSSRLSSTPTQWGTYQPGEYYQPPTSYPIQLEFFPVARNSWGRISVWFAFSASDWITESLGRKEYTLKDAYPLASVISVLLGQIAPGITHEATAEYSQFLYGENPISGITQHLLITPKSNVISSGYDQPAQKAMLTLASVLQMLRDCFRCYWYVEDGKFKIEHIKFFMRGGSYNGAPGVGLDLTELGVSRNGKKWAFGTSKYSFEKPDMAARYQFGWMDDVTQLFEGYPIDIVSKFVDPENIENINIGQFTSDVDYILLNPDDISKDGFVLLAAEQDGDDYRLPYFNFNFDGADHWLQNAYVAFIFLQQYYFWDMPAPNFKINGIQYTAQGVKKLKTQTLDFPCLVDPEMFRLIKTNLGNGMIQKLSLNLSSRKANATLRYDTE